MDLMKDWWIDWRMDWPFIEYEGKATGFTHNYENTLPDFFRDLEETDPELRQKYYQQEFYNLLMTMVNHRDLASIRRLFDCCPGWHGNGCIEGLSPLGQALDNGDIACMRLLLEKGADPELYEQTMTVLEAAIDFRMGMEVYRMLLDFGAVFTRNALLALVCEGEEDTIRYMMDHAQTLQYDSREGLLDAAVEAADVYITPEEQLPAGLALLHKLLA